MRVTEIRNLLDSSTPIEIDLEQGPMRLFI